MESHLTENQIQELYLFTQRHYIEWYDVQTELVDHLANGIENLWRSNSDLSFDDALKIEFTKFGIFGFSDFMEQKTNALDKYYRKQVWLYLKEYFDLPKIIGTLFFVWGLYKTIHYMGNKLYITVSFVVLTFIGFGLFLKKTKRAIKIRETETGKKWLFENSLIQLGGIGHFMNIGIWIQIIFDPKRQWSVTSEKLLSGGIIFYILFLYVSVIVVPKKLKQKMSKQYPAYSFN